MTAQISPRVAKIIEHCKLFESVDSAVLEKLEVGGHLHAYPPGQKLITEGDPSSDLFIIESGTVEVTTHSPDGEVALAKLGVGDVIGEVPASTGAKRTSTARAVDMVNALVIHADLLQEVFSAFPKVAERMYELIESRAMDTIAKTIPEHDK